MGFFLREVLFLASGFFADERRGVPFFAAGFFAAERFVALFFAEPFLAVRREVEVFLEVDFLGALARVDFAIVPARCGRRRPPRKMLRRRWYSAWPLARSLRGGRCDT
ncbi:MAG: hypothetical protein JNK72_24865 [Myxococcales bacterium]|nr:hypothetical protein [Myxococcales bacterium]